VPPAGMDLGVDPEHPGWRFGIRLGLQDVVGIDDRQIESLLVGRPFTSVGDVRRRASLSAPVAEGLAHAGALDDLGGVQAGACTRRDLLLEVTERWSGLRRHGWVGGDQDPAQPEQLDLLGDPEPPGLAEYRPSDRVRAELEVLGMEASRHVITFYDDLLDLLEVTRTVDLLDRRNGERVRVAGVKVATQTPPVKSGQRIIFLSVDDATGVSDATFFESVHERCAWTVFHTWLLVVEGTVHRTGARGIGINADAIWDLRRLMRAWREGWLNEAMAEAGRPHAEAARDFSDQAPGGTQGVPGRSGLGPDPQGDQAVTGLPARDDRPYSGRGPASGALASDHHHPLYAALHLDEARRRRADEEPGRPSRMGPNGATWADPAQRHPGVDPIDVVRLPSGHPAHPDRVPADQEGRPAPPRRRPAAEEEGDPPRKLWHASGGSAGH
jgi:error-prone DNA polymerase